MIKNSVLRVLQQKASKKILETKLSNGGVVAQLGMWLKMERFGGSIGDVVAHRVCGGTKGRGGGSIVDIVAQLRKCWLRK